METGGLRRGVMTYKSNIANKGRMGSSNGYLDAWLLLTPQPTGTLLDLAS